MKIKLALLNSSLFIYLIGLLCTIGMGMQMGAIIILIATVIILAVYIIQIFQSIRKKNLWSGDNLIYTLSILILAVIFIHGFSVSINMPLLNNFPGFRLIYLVAGLGLVSLFLIGSICLLSSIDNRKRKVLLVTLVSIVSGAFALGILGMAGILPVSAWFITYGLMFLIIGFFMFFLFYFFKGNKAHKRESGILVWLSISIFLFLILRFYLPQLLPRGFTNSLIVFGFFPAIILPISLSYLDKFHFFTVFVLFFIFLDFYLIHADRNVNYLLTVGIDECVGYENALTYPVNDDLGIAIDDLLKEPTESELNTILTEWQQKDFSPRQIRTEYQQVHPNGDSIKVVSHLVHGQRHYGLIRIPRGIDLSKAPLLLGLMGGGTGMDILKTSDLDRLSRGRCRKLLDNYISIMPSFRGNLLKGEDFCFRSEGYAGDVWMGAAEDAVALLEVVKLIYNKTDRVKTLATGISRGATVALIIGGLTNKVDYVIASSTHTKFLDRYVLDNERVGNSFSRAFYTPKATPDEIRKRIITSSPYFFANNLPACEIHQGTEDQKTTVWHVQQLETRLKESRMNDNSNNIYMYEGKGHGYSDDSIVCASLGKFLEK